jgi:hypothetical protein
VGPEEERAHVDHIARRLYALIVQRECAGATHGNLERICAVYDVPRPPSDACDCPDAR